MIVRRRALTAAAIVAGAVAPQAAVADTVHGTVAAAGAPLAHARVTLMAGGRQGPTALGHAVADESGRFSFTYDPPGSGVVYAEATPHGSTALRMRAVVGQAGGTVTVNELTTVATTYALAQFSQADGIAGPSPGLENAAATAANLADAATGGPGTVVTNADNGANNDTLATLDTLANLVSLCAPGRPAACRTLFRLATPPGAAAPQDTVQAVLDLAHSPTLQRGGLYALARRATTFRPARSAPPQAWILVLLYTDQGLYASGRIGLDAHGNAWSNNNWVAGTQKPSPYVTVLDPGGRPTLGSPITGGGMKGGGWGTAIATDGDVWMDSFGGNAISQYSADGRPLSPRTGWTNGNLDHPQGIAVDQRGNVWIANNYGPESAPGQGNVVVYPGGDASKAITVTGGGLNHPFAVQIDAYGRAWVSNAGLGGARLVGTRAAILVGKFSGSVTVIGTDFKPTSFSPITNSAFRWPLGIAVDSKSNVWTANYFSSSVTRMSPDGQVAGTYRLPRSTLPWSVAIDGGDRAWVAGFRSPAVWLLCGAQIASCPPGSVTGSLVSPKLGFHSRAFQHFTSIQLDQSGNVWVSNNWSQLVPHVGGTGIAEIVGAATPVCTPLQPLPQKPAASGTACPKQAAVSLPATSDPSDSGPSAWLWVAIGAGLLALGALAMLLIRRRGSPR